MRQHATSIRIEFEAMTRLLTLLFTLLVSATAHAASEPLLTPVELAARLGQAQLRIIDIRDGKNDSGKTPYEVGHIAGALSAPYSKWRGPKDNPGQLPSTEQLTPLVRSLGIDATTPVVVVYEGRDATDFGSAARVYWTLKAAGITQLAILNGGVRAWRAANLPLTTDVVPVPPSTYVVKLDQKLIATQDEVAQLTGKGDTVLLDGRPAAYFAGETRHTAAKAPGTLIGAKNVEHSVWFAKDSAALLPPADIQRIAREQGIESERPTASFCNTGHWAATNWFVLSEVLGHKDVSLYPESVVGWSQSDLPMANVPNRLHQFWLQLKEATGNL
jgi:thiosulfate/3-mercaptopyruvate sulfurtransferase